MFDDVAVPDIETVDIKLGLDAGDLTRQCDHRVLEAQLVCMWRSCYPGWNQVAQEECGRIQGFTVNNFETHQMQMDRVGIHGGIEDFPDFRTVQEGNLGNWITPHLRNGCKNARDSLCQHAQ